MSQATTVLLRCFPENDIVDETHESDECLYNLESFLKRCEEGRAGASYPSRSDVGDEERSPNRRGHNFDVMHFAGPGRHDEYDRLPMAGPRSGPRLHSSACNTRSFAPAFTRN